MKFVASVLTAAAALATAGAAQACVAVMPSVVLEFAEGSAELDATDREEIAAFYAKARELSPVPWVTVRAFADRAGSFEASSWSETDLALARARGQAASDALVAVGGPVADRVLVGVAPNGAETRAGADGVARHGRAVAMMQRPESGPTPSDGRPVPTC